MCFDIPVAYLASVQPGYLWSKRGRYWWYENVYLVTLGVRYAFQHTEMLHYHYVFSQILFFFGPAIPGAKLLWLNCLSFAL